MNHIKQFNEAQLQTEIFKCFLLQSNCYDNQVIIKLKKA